MNPVLELRGITVPAQPRPRLEGIDLTIRQG